jgi:hypothetical protein
MKKMKFRLNKKGLMFTIMTVLLFFSLFIFSKTYLERSENFKYTLVQTSIPEKMRYIEDDIVSNLYFDIMDINVSNIERSGGELSVNFSNTIYFQNNQNYDTKMQDYQTFIEEDYAMLQNVDLTLTNFGANLTIEPYQSIIDIDESQLLILNNASKMQEISLSLKVNEEDYTTLNEDTTAGTETIILIVLNSTNDMIHQDSYSLDPTVESTVTLSFGSNDVTIKFGNFDSYPDSTLQLQTDLYTELTELGFVYTEDSEITVIRGGNFTISNVINDISKETEIILVEE